MEGYSTVKLGVSFQVRFLLKPSKRHERLNAYLHRSWTAYRSSRQLTGKVSKALGLAFWHDQGLISLNSVVAFTGFTLR